MRKENLKAFFIILFLILILCGGYYLIIYNSKNINDILIINKSIELKYGQNYKIDYKIKPSSASNTSLKWISSDPDKVSVDNEGNLYIYKNGNYEVTITVTAPNGVSEEVVVKINEVQNNVSVTGINVETKELKMQYKQKSVIKALVIPENATNKAIVWTSSDSSLVKVDNNGNVEVVDNRDGEVKLTVKTVDGGITKDVKVIVSFVETNTDIETITLDKSEINLNYNETTQIKAIVNSSKSYKVSWASSNPSLVSVDQDGNIKALDPNGGSATITATIPSLKSASATVIVPKAEENISLTSEKEVLTVGDTLVINAYVTPKINNSKITWTSSNNSIASVSNGIVKAKNSGIVTITATTSSKKKAQIKITIKNNNEISSGFLKASGTKIVDNTGKSVLLRGFNLGAWLSRSYSMSAFVPFADSEDSFLKTGLSCINNESFYQALEKNPNNFTNEQIQKLSNTLYDNFITEKDFDLIAQTGANVIRLPIEYTYFTLLNTNMETDFKRIDWAIEQAKKRGIYVILDLHLVEGRQNSGGWCDGFTFFDNTTYMNNAIELWGHLAYRYRNETAVAGYDILNEPGTSITKLVNFYDKVYQKIRRYDNNHIIIMEENCVVCGHSGANRNNTIGDLPNPSSKGWSNVVYSVHDYPNLDSNSSNDDKKTLPNVLMSRLKSRLSLIETKMKKYNIPYYVGEFSYLGSTTQRANQNNRYREYLCVWECAMDEYERLGLSYTPWTYKANNELYYGLVYYATTKSKADLLNDSYDTLLKKFSYHSSDNMRFNEDFYMSFLNQFGGRIAKKIVLSQKEVVLKKGESVNINYTINPSTAIDKNVSWSSSNPGVATVDKNTGKITAISSGKTIITVQNQPFAFVIDSNDIYYCSSALKNSLCTCEQNDNFIKSLDIKVSNTITVVVE